MVVWLSRVDLMGMPSLLTMMVPMTPLWATRRFRVSSTSAAIFLAGKDPPLGAQKEIDEALGPLLKTCR